MYLDVPEDVRLERRIKRDMPNEDASPTTCDASSLETQALMHDRFVELFRHRAHRTVALHEDYGPVADELIERLFDPSAPQADARHAAAQYRLRRASAGASLDLLVLILALVTASCGGGGDDTQQVEMTLTPPRTYEDLDLSGPEAAVDEFISAFVRRDHIAAALICTPMRNWRRAPWSTRTTSPASSHRTPNRRLWPGCDRTQRRPLPRRDACLRDGEEEAMTNGGFIVDLASGAEGLTLRTSDQFGAVVEGILSSNGSDVVFELAPTSDERWRIRSARLANGTPLQIPFSGTPTVDSPARNLEPRNIWRSTLPNDSPQELLDTIVTLVGLGDYVSLYLLLDETGQRGAAEQLPPSISPDHGLVAMLLDTRLDTAGFPVDVTDAEPIASETLTIAQDVGIGEAITFAVTVGENALDVTMARDSAGAWRLRRMVPAGELTAPTPFPLG